MNTKIITENIQHYNLKWTNYTNNLLEIFIDQFNKGFLTDVSLYCEGTLIRAHKMVLAACSLYFAVYSEPNPLIILNGIQLKDLNIVIEFMYRGEIKVQETELQHILKLARDLQVKGLSELNDKLAPRNNPHHDKPDTKNAATEGESSKTTIQNNNPEPSQKDSVCSSAATVPKIKILDANEIQERPLVHQPQLSENDQTLPSQPAINDNNVQVNHEGTITNLSSPEEIMHETNISEPLTSVPAKAFVVFANMVRQRLMNHYPDEQPKDISVRVGLMWKGLSALEKKKFYARAKKTSSSTRIANPLSIGTDLGQLKSLKRKRKIESKPLSEDTSNIITFSGCDDDDVEFIEEITDLSI